MCPQANGRESDFLKKMPFDVFRKILDDGKKHGCELISLHGSGEATLHPELPEFTAYAKSLGIDCMIVTNGYRLTADLSRKLINAGMDTIRVSCIGYDRLSYEKWMSKDAFELVRENIKNFLAVKASLGGATHLTT